MTGTQCPYNDPAVLAACARFLAAQESFTACPCAMHHEAMRARLAEAVFLVRQHLGLEPRVQKR